MGTKLNLAPVFYTLSQVRFNPIAQMSEYVPRIQDHLRRRGFPDFRPEVQVELAIRRPDEPQPDIQPQQRMRWSFTNTQRTEGYLLLSDVLIFHTTEYDSFKDFSDKIISGLALVHELVELAYVERIGLRYLNAIVPLAGDTLEHYLNPSLMGLSVTFGDGLRHSFTETVTQIDNGTLVARSVISDGGLALPPDLFPLQLELQSRFASITNRNAVLDIDYFITKRSNLILKQVETQLLASHNIVETAFKVSVTGDALKRWT